MISGTGISRTVSRLDAVVHHLRTSPGVADKVAIRQAYAPALETRPDPVVLGDDCAAIPDPSGGHLLCAAEGLQEGFVADDPWFAGYSALMVNVSDVCAMGGRPLAVVDVLWSPDEAHARDVWAGMIAASQAYGVPIVGGHTTLTRRDTPVYLAAAILGRARVLMTSFDARPGDDLLFVVDLDGSYRGDRPFWNASVGKSPRRLRELTELLPRTAESGWCVAAKDVSNGGLVGTLVMLLECSGVGAVLDLAALRLPSGVDLERWLVSFPSYGYLLSVAREHRDAVQDHFESHSVSCSVVGRVVTGQSLELTLAGETCVFWRGRSDA